MSRPHFPRRNALTLLLCSALLTSLPLAQAAPPPSSNKPLATGTGGAVASISQPASEAAITILNQGGNAIDAAVAAAATLGVSDPFSCGIGGGGFMMIYLAKEKRIISIDHRETAPTSFHANVFQDLGKEIGRGEAVASGAAVGVPGTVRGWHEALSRYGKLSFKQVLAPAIQFADKGFVVTENFHYYNQANERKFALFTTASDLYMKDGKALPVGSLLRNPGMARAYREIGEYGVRHFYEGNLAQAIVNATLNPPVAPGVKVRPGYLSMSDMANYEARIRLPIHSTYRGYDVYGMSLPSSGGATVSAALNILEGFNLSGMPRAAVEHLYIEASRLAYADRNAYLADPEFVETPLQGLLSKAYATQRRKLIDPARANAKVEAGDPFPFQQDPSYPLRPANKVALLSESPHTTHLTVSDKDGNVVSYTFTIESWGGSGIVVPGYGFILNNEMTDFDFSGPHPNVPEAGKRPRSSMAPTIVLKDGKPAFTIGSPGGSTIITTVLQTIVNHIDLRMPLDLALAAPRMSQRNSEQTIVEAGFVNSEQGQALGKLGHQWRDNGEIGAASALLFNADGSVTAISEPRRHGIGSAMVQKPKP
jgi:gamma-glutamyltranspeptidase / glutathione hydrolase